MKQNLKTLVVIAAIILLGKLLLPAQIIPYTTVGSQGNPIFTSLPSTVTNFAGFAQVNTTQFSTNENTLNIKDGALVTNLNVSGKLGVGTTTPTAITEIAGTKNWLKLSNTFNSMTWHPGGGWTNATGLLFTNHSNAGGLTNLAAVDLPAFALTNNGDSASVTFFILPKRFPATNTFALVYGSETVAIFSGTRSTNWVIILKVLISQTGPTSQDVTTLFDGMDGAGTNNWVAGIRYISAQTNWVNTTIQLQGAALSPFAYTNYGFKTFYEPVL